ncbi:hypothetical protein EHYA_03597 [Embleya hyalina]|uniref:Uncharacterized protein n=1 Tax=Embleya hyalina TaxID=516124 RepID=A0A401YMR4_9ACTN|nr:hypothetical protein EHYA_03597 [Embleya hyalina]
MGERPPLRWGPARRLGVCSGVFRRLPRAHVPSHRRAAADAQPSVARPGSAAPTDGRDLGEHRVRLERRGQRADAGHHRSTYRPVLGRREARRHRHGEGVPDLAVPGHGEAEGRRFPGRARLPTGAGDAPHCHGPRSRRGRAAQPVRVGAAGLGSERESPSGRPRRPAHHHQGAVVPRIGRAPMSRRHAVFDQLIRSGGNGRSVLLPVAEQGHEARGFDALHPYEAVAVAKGPRLAGEPVQALGVRGRHRLGRHAGAARAGHRKQLPTAFRRDHRGEQRIREQTDRRHDVPGGRGSTARGRHAAPHAPSVSPHRAASRACGTTAPKAPKGS